MKPIFENQPPFNPNFKFDVQSTPTALTTQTTRPDAQATDLEAYNQIEKIKSRKFHTAKKISAMILVAFIILGWFSYFVKHAGFPEFRAGFTTVERFLFHLKTILSMFHCLHNNIPTEQDTENSNQAAKN